METKTLHVEIKNEDEGVVQARFATLGVRDKDGDLTEPGAFGEQKVRVSAYQHSSWMGALPVGAGRIREDGDAAIADLQFFMQTQHGRDHFETIKGLGPLGEWSYGFDVLDEAKPSEEQAALGVVRILKKLRVHEVSPVLLGAGIDTRTLATKDAKVLVSARTPTVDGTEDVEWSKPTLDDYRAGLGLGEGAWGDLTAAERQKIAKHTLLGEASAETFDEANVFPVVNPRTAKLNGNAVRNAAARADQTSLSDATVESVRFVCSRLLEDYFKTAPDPEAELKEAIALEIGRAELHMVKMAGER